ncbi:hypothetical protein JCM10212_003143 [Sporobolomyces blumeae]
MSDALEASLPMSTFVLDSVPSHPIPHLVLDPVLTRLATFEAVVLASKPSLALRRLGASDRTVVAIVAFALAAALARWRRQWRAVTLFLGVGEAVVRTLKLVQAEEKNRPIASTSAIPPATNRQHDGRPDQAADATETQHLLSFWTLFVAVSALESLRPSPLTSSLAARSPWTTRMRNSLRLVRQSYLRFLRMWIVPFFYRSRYHYLSLVRTYPRFDVSQRIPAFPSVPFARQFAHLLTPSYRPPKPSVFPQPLPVSADVATALSTFPLPHTYFASATTTRLTAELRWEVVKLLVLWTGLRKDAFGAKSVLFDWILGPVVRRWTRDARGPDESTEYKIYKVARARPNRRALDDECRSSQQQSRSIPADGRDGVEPVQEQEQELDGPDSFPRSISPSPPPSPRALSPRPSPIWTTRTPPRAHPSSASSRRPGSTARHLEYTPPAPLAASESPTFPTPHHVPYRLASSAHPLLQAYTGSNASVSPRRSDPASRDSLLLESPPRSLSTTVGLARRSRRGSSSTTSSIASRPKDDDARDERSEDAESPARTEAEEGIKRWATVSRVPAAAVVDVIDAVGDRHGVEGGGDVRSLDAVGRGWSV